MALTIYPTDGYDSLISEVDATTFITLNSVNSAQWIALTSQQREVYLRIATTKILEEVSYDATNTNGYLDALTYVAEDSCLPNACALMAIHDVVYAISSSVNPNEGLIKREKVGDIEVEYDHSKASRGSKGIEVSPFPKSVVKCLTSYGAVLYTGGISQATLMRS